MILSVVIVQGNNNHGFICSDCTGEKRFTGARCRHLCIPRGTEADWSHIRDVWTGSRSVLLSQV